MPRPRSQSEHFRWQAGWCERLGSPLYSYLLERAAGDLEAGGPAARVVGDRDASEHSMLALSLMGAVHRIVLEGRAPDLAASYPSVGGKVDLERAWDAFSALLESNPDEVGRGLERPVQTNEVGRAAALVGGFLHVAGDTGLPLRILELGASAGLHLRWDHYFYEARGRTWGPADSPVRLCSFDSQRPLPFDVAAVVAERRGCDTNPIDAATDDGALTLLSYLWADQLARHRLLRVALEVARTVPVEIDREDVVEWARHNVHPVEGAATVVYHSIVMQYLSRAARSEVERMLRGAGAEATAGSPLAWLRMEPGEGEAEIRLTVWPPAQERVAARSGFHGQHVRWLL